MNATLDKLIGALRQAGLEFTAENLADSLWLAPHLPPTPLDRMPVRPATESKPPVSPPEPKKDPAEDAGKTPSASPEAQGGRPGVDAQLPVTAHGEAGAVLGMPVRLPGAASLPEALAIARALRPLRKRMATNRWYHLDEKGTAERLAAGDIWQPVLLPGRERWLSATIVVDAGASMAVWRSMVDEFRAVLQSLGAFRRIEVRRLDTDGKPDEPVPVYASRQSSVRHDPRDLADPSGRTFFLIVSDCVGVAWWDGRVATLLERWGRTNHAAVLQILPRTLWGRTALGAERAVSLTSPRAVCPNANLAAFATGKFRSNVKLDTGDSVPVPVLELGAASLAAWASDAASATGARFTGRLLRLNPAPAPPVAERSPALGDPFLSVASVPARKLANLMATAPPFNLPLLRVIRESRLAGEATQIHEAEFLLGGLLTVASGREERIDNPDGVIYDFTSPELRQMLRSAVPVSEAIEVLRLEEVGEYLGRHLGRPGGFSAMFRAPEHYAGGLELAPTGDGDPIARFTADMLQWFGGKYAELVSVKPVEGPRPAFHVLVAGTGDYALSDPVWLTAEQVGRWAARRGYGLVTGGWPGVDHVTARAFADALDPGRPIERWLAHVVRRGTKPDFTKGAVIEVDSEGLEYERAIELANAVVLVGGLGGTSNVARHALEMHVPVFPLPWTDGDAANVYHQILENWTEYDWMGLSRDRFAALSNPSLALDIIAEHLRPTRKEPEPTPPQVPDTVARLLFVASKPPEGPQVLSDEELGAIGTIFMVRRIVPLRCEFQHDVTWDEFRAVLASLKPNVLHFCGHSEGGHLVFGDGAGGSRLVDPETFADAVGTAYESLRVIVLNADETGAFATAAMKRLPGSVIVATERVVSDKRAIRFAADFYGQLADGHSVRGAFKYASQPQPDEGPTAYSMWSNEADADRMTVRTGFADELREPPPFTPDDTVPAEFQDDPGHGRAALLLGRLHRANGQYQEAVAVLTSAIEADSGRTGSSDDVAELLYNRACYHALLLQSERAFEDLIRSVRLAPRYADAARRDADFQSLRGDRRFAALLDNPRPHRILIVGSRDPRLPLPVAEEFARNCRHLGAALARAGFGFVLGSFSEDTADHHVLRGLAEAEGPVNIAFIRPQRRALSPELEEALAGHLVERTLPAASWNEVRPLQFQAADLILAIGGGEGTRQILNIAPTASQPLIPIQTYPGAARDAWPAARQRLAKAGIPIPLIDRLNHSFDVGAIVETVRACLSGPLRDPDGLLPLEEIHRIVLESENLRDGDSITGDLLLFESVRHRQHTWLVATADHVFILLDDEKTREKRSLIQWRLRRSDLLPLAIDPAKRTVGFAGRPKPQWYYSTLLFPSPRELEDAISSLVEGGTLDRA